MKIKMKIAYGALMNGQTVSEYIIVIYFTLYD